MALLIPALDKPAVAQAPRPFAGYRIISDAGEFPKAAEAALAALRALNTNPASFGLTTYAVHGVEGAAERPLRVRALGISTDRTTVFFKEDKVAPGHSARYVAVRNTNGITQVVGVFAGPPGDTADRAISALEVCLGDMPAWRRSTAAAEAA